MSRGIISIIYIYIVYQDLQVYNIYIYVYDMQIPIAYFWTFVSKLAFRGA